MSNYTKMIKSLCTRLKKRMKKKKKDKFEVEE